MDTEVYEIYYYLQCKQDFIDFNEDIEDDINIECKSKKLQDDLMQLLKNM